MRRMTWRRTSSAPTGSSILLAEDPTRDDYYYEPDVAYNLNHNEYLAVYTRRLNPPGPESSDVIGRRVTAGGVPLQEHAIDATSNDQYQPAVAAYGVQEDSPDVAGSEALGGYTVVWASWNLDWDVWGRRVGHDGTLGNPFNVSMYGRAIGYDEVEPAVAGGAPIGLAVWEDSFSGGNKDVYGRLLGYRVVLPIILRGL